MHVVASEPKLSAQDQDELVSAFTTIHGHQKCPGAKGSVRMSKILKSTRINVSARILPRQHLGLEDPTWSDPDLVQDCELHLLSSVSMLSHLYERWPNIVKSDEGTVREVCCSCSCPSQSAAARFRNSSR